MTGLNTGCQTAVTRDDGQSMNTMAVRNDIVCADVEASSLPIIGSYPIELAVADLDGITKSWLIRPTDAWASSGLWDATSARVHGISYEQLVAEGLPPEQVADEFTAAIGGRRALSDAAPSDRFWLGRLYDAVGRDAPPIEPVELLLQERAPGVEGAHRIAQAKEFAFRCFPREHRAAEDAGRLIEVIRILS